MTITLKYITDTTVGKDITVKDFDFVWVEEFWDKGVSITGKKRNAHRGYKPLLELQFENDIQLNTVAKEILDTLQTGTVYYTNEKGDLPLVPTEFRSFGDYLNQIERKPSTLVLEGNIQSNRTFIITGVTCGATDVFCGQTDVLCGG